MASAHRENSPTNGPRAALDDELFSNPGELHRVLAETSPDFVILITPEGVIRYINRVMEEHDRASVPGTSVYDYVTPEEGAAMKLCFERVMRTGEMDRYETTYISPVTGRHTFDCRVAPIWGSDRIVGLTINASDVTHLKHVEHALRETMENQRALIDQSPVGIISVAPNGAIISANPAFRQLLADTDAPLQNVIAFDLMHPEDQPASRQRMADLVCRRKVTCRAELRFRRSDGSYTWTRLTASPIYNDTGEIARLVCIIEDIEEARRAEERQKMLMRELDHRVKNNLAAIVTLSKQSIECSDSLEDFGKRFIGRVHAMARSHEALAGNKWKGLDLDRALRATLESHLQEKPSRVHLMGDPVSLESHTVMPLCLTVHELATNAVRHGALASLAGNVHVSWSRHNGDLNILWRETGGPPPQQTPRPGVGTSLIEGFVRHELRGSIDMRFASQGLECSITIPIADKPAESAISPPSASDSADGSPQDAP